MSQTQKPREPRACERALSAAKGPVPLTSAHRSESALLPLLALSPSTEFTPSEAEGLRSRLGTPVAFSTVPESRKQLRDTRLLKCRRFIRYPEIVGPEINSAEGSLGEGTGPEKRPFLIATRTDSRKELTRWKQRTQTLSNRNKIHFVCCPLCGPDRRAREEVKASDSGIGRDTAAREGLAQ